MEACDRPFVNIFLADEIPIYYSQQHATSEESLVASSPQHQEGFAMGAAGSSSCLGEIPDHLSEVEFDEAANNHHEAADFSAQPAQEEECPEEVKAIWKAPDC